MGAGQTRTRRQWPPAPWAAWEAALGLLEGGHAVAYASGMAAVAAVLGVTVRPGDTVVLPADSYYAVRRLASTWLEPMGITIRLAPTRASATSRTSGWKRSSRPTPRRPASWRPGPRRRGTDAVTSDG